MTGPAVGWLNRTLGLDTSTAPQQGVHLGSGMVPTALYGRSPTLAVSDVDATDLNGPTGVHRRDRAAALAQMWSRTGGDLGTSARSALRVAREFEGVAGRASRPENGASYPVGDLGDALQDAARLIRADLGVRALTVDYGSWDMHAGLGTVGSKGPSTLHVKTAELAHALHAFYTDLGTLGAQRVTLVTISEFGRRVAENGSRGLDHGWGSTMLVMGAGVKGGRYLGRWPGLGSGRLTDGDLAVTTDYRSVLSEVLTRRFDVSTSQVFPGFAPEAVGVLA